jgi:ATP-dependent Lhr-like helicase
LVIDRVVVGLRRPPVQADRNAVPFLPEAFARWFEARGWTPRRHQLDLLAAAQAGRSALLIAPTGGGKTLAGFLPTLVELAEPRRWQSPPSALVGEGRLWLQRGSLHTLYISPLKALAVDIARNLERPVAEMGLPIRIETRTGDTPASRRSRQRRYPPDILLTTPEQLALLLASADAPSLFGTLRRVVLDELHALVTSKRGDLLALGLARLFRLAPQITTIGLSATVAEPAELTRYLAPQPPGGTAHADLVTAEPGAAPIRHAGHGRMSSLGRPLGAPRSRRNLCADRAPPHHARLRQYAQPGRNAVSGAVAHQ